MPKKRKNAPAPAVTVVEEASPVAFSPAEAKKLVKLLKAADRSKRLDAINTVSENHEYITHGGCLLPLLESVVAKKKMEDVIRAAGQAIVNYLAGKDDGNPNVASENTLKAMEEAKKSPTKYKMAEVLGKFALNSDQRNSWNAVRSLRSMAAVVASLPVDSPQKSALVALLTGAGQPAECLCSLFIKQEKQRVQEESETAAGSSGKVNKEDAESIVPWAAMRLQVTDTLGVMCAFSKEAVKSVVTSGAVPFLLGVLRWIATSESPEMPLLTSILSIVFSVASEGTGMGVESEVGHAAATFRASEPSPELLALAEGGAWGIVYDTLKGPIMARTAQLQAGASGKKLDTEDTGAISPELVDCLDNMGRCAEVLRVMATTGAGLEQKGALEAGVAAMNSIIGMQGLPREEAAVANLLTGIVKAMGSIASLSETNRIKVCSAGAAPMVLALMVLPDSPAGTATTPLSLDTPHGRMMRKTAEKCLHHLLTSRVTWMADDRALCNTSLTAQNESGRMDSENDIASAAPAATTVRRGSIHEQPPYASGPAYLSIDAVLAALNADSIDVRCRTIRLVSRLASSRRNLRALGRAAVPALARLIAWWIRIKDNPQGHLTPRPSESIPFHGNSTPSSSIKSAPLGSKTSSPSAKDSCTVEEDLSEAEQLAAEQLENEDITRVLRDEALSYTLGVLLELANTGREEQLAIGNDAVIDLLVKVLRALPCTPEEFTSNLSSTSNRSAGLESSKIPLSPVVQSFEGDGIGGRNSTNSHSRPDTSLNLGATACTRITERQVYCWRWGESRDPEIHASNPEEWSWDFEAIQSHQPAQHGVILRAVVLRVLTAIVDGFTPSAESISALSSAPVKAGKSSATGTSATTSGVTAVSATSTESGARSVLKRALPVCLDLLSVDVHLGKRGNGRRLSEKAAQNGITDDAQSIMAEQLLGTPVSTSEELMHPDIRLGCLQLVASLLRLGSIAREGLVSAADAHRGGWTQLVEELADQHPVMVETSVSMSVGVSNAGDQPWVKPETFRCWDFQEVRDIDSLKTSLPYVRVISTLLLPLRNPDAPTVHVMTALVALGRLCREAEYEGGGKQPEPSLDVAKQMPSSREGTACALADTFAGVTVALGALVPLMAIWGSGIAIAGEGAFSAQTIRIVNQCQELIDFLVRRGQTRETFWSSLPPSATARDEKTGSAGNASQKKTQSKSKGTTKRGKGGGKEGQPKAAALVAGITARQGDSLDASATPPSLPLGQPDPNLGPDRATWAHLLNSRVDDPRTSSSGTNALLMAANIGLEKPIYSLLLAGADPNVRADDGRTPLMYALAQGMDEVVRKLVDSGADVDVVDSHGSSVLKAAFLCPPRYVMRSMMRRQMTGAPYGAASVTAAAVGAATAVVATVGEESENLPQPSFSLSRRGSSRTEASTDLPGSGRPRSRSRSGSVTVGVKRTRNHCGSLAVGPRRSSLGRIVSSSDGRVTNFAASTFSGRLRLSRTCSMSAIDSARAGSRGSRRGSMKPLETTRGTMIIQGNARMVPYMLAHGADPDVSSAMGDFPLHWAVTGTELTVSIMNRQVRMGSERSKGGTDDSNFIGTEKRPRMSSSTHSENTERGEQTTIHTKTGPEPTSYSDDLSLMRVLVEHGASLDACDPEGVTALHAAVITDRLELAAELLDSGASPNVLDSQGCLPLHYACLRASRGYEGLARRLLALGTGRPFRKAIHSDLRKGKTRREKLLQDLGEIMRSGLREATAPSSIAQHRATRTELLNYVSAEGLTPLHYLCNANMTSRHIISAVLERSHRRELDLSQHPSQDGSLMTRLAGQSSAADTSERIKILRWLLSESEVDLRVRGPRGTTMLHLAAQIPGSHGADICQALIRTGINLNALDTPVTSGSLMQPCLSTTTQCTLPESGGTRADIDRTVSTVSDTDEDRAPMVCALGKKQEGTPASFSALHYALRARAWETANVLVAAGASARPEGAYPPCLHVACHMGAPASLITRLLENRSELFCHATRPAPSRAKRWARLIPADADFDCYRATPLFLAARIGSAELVQLLLPMYSFLPNVSSHDLSLKSPIDPSSYGKKGAIEDVWSVIHSLVDGRNPLHAAAAGGHTSVAQILLKSGGGQWLNTVDVTGQIPLDLAVAGSMWEVALVIASAGEFDARLAITGGPSSALISVERINMQIVDEGSGDPSALMALRDSNALIMILLKRLRDIETGRLANGTSDAAGMTTDGQERCTDSTEACVINPEARTATSSGHGCDAGNLTSSNDDCGSNGENKDKGVSTRQASPPRLTPIHHLHHCFAEGVLYSNAKGVCIPDTPGLTNGRSPPQPNRNDKK